MRREDVIRDAVQTALSDMRSPFRTKDLSNHPAMVDAHPLFYEGDKYYHRTIGSYLSYYGTDLGIVCLDRRNNALWEKTEHRGGERSASVQPGNEEDNFSLKATSSRYAASRVVRDGHFKSLEYMSSPEFLRVKALFESHPEIGGAYFRPTNKGVIAVDLHPASPKPRIGIGKDPCIRCGTKVETLLPTMPERIAYLEDVRARQCKPSEENQFEARLIREAQANHLILPDFPTHLRFVYSQWRLDTTADGTQQFADIIAVDIQEHCLVLIELKRKPCWVAISLLPPSDQIGISKSPTQLSEIIMANRFKVVTGGPYPHFITMTITRWQPVFVSGPYFRIILDSLEYLRQNRGLAIHSYVIMPTHLHAVTTAQNDDLPAVVRDFKRFTARAIYEQAVSERNDLLAWIFRNAAATSQAKTKVWKDEFHPEAVYSSDFFFQKTNYLHDNPVRKGLVADAVKWYYSSASAYVGGETGPLELDWLEW